MSLQPIAGAALPAALAGSAPLLRFQRDATALNTLELGQVIQARVMRVFQGGRYLMDFNGQERVVDSTIPLQQGEVLRGRVVALDKQVVLEKILAAPAALPQSNAAQAAAAPAWLQRLEDAQALALFRQFSGVLTPPEWQALDSSAHALGANDVVLAALTLKRNALPLEPALLKVLAQAKAGTSLLAPGRQLLEATLTPANAATLAQLHADAEQLGRLVEDELAAAQTLLRQEADQQQGGGQNTPDQQRDAALWAALANTMLNAQQPGALAHRLMSLPLAIDGRLVELQLALFDDAEQAELLPELRQRTVRIALDLDSLGRVELVARVVNRHLSVEICVASEDGAAMLGEHDRQLSGLLTRMAWSLDGASYTVAPMPLDGGSALVRSVMQRMVEGDNFSIEA